MKCYLIHGFNVKDSGEDTIDRLIPYVEAAGMEPVQLEYGWTGRVGVRLCNKKLARFLAEMAEPGSYAIGHSNGCALLHAATHYGAAFKRIAYINPALDRDKAPGAQVRGFDVWHSPSDKPVRFARFIPFSPWGAMGATGYTGDDSRADNYNKEDLFPVSSRKHSDVFSNGLVEYFGPRIVAALQGRYMP